MKMKKIDKLALVAIVLMIVSRVAAPFSNILIAHLYGPRDIQLLQSVSVAATLPFVLLINIGIGVWLYIEAKKDGSTPWVWCLFGFVSGLMGVAVFYLIRIYDLMKTTANKSSEPT